MKKKIAVLGTGRSGTNFFAAVLHELGHDVQHEQFGADGIASWCLVADCNDAVYGPGGGQLDPDFIVGHQLRNPLKAIGSLTTFNRSSWRFISENYASRDATLAGLERTGRREGAICLAPGRSTKRCAGDFGGIGVGGKYRRLEVRI